VWRTILRRQKENNKKILQKVKTRISLEDLTKKAENAIFWTSDETSIHGEINKTVNHCRNKEKRPDTKKPKMRYFGQVIRRHQSMGWKYDIKTVTELSVIDLKQCNGGGKVPLMSVKHNSEEETNQCLTKQKAKHSFERMLPRTPRRTRRTTA
jgi:hypothetical protein